MTAWGGAAELGTDCLEVVVVQLHLDEEGIELLRWVQHIQNGICGCSRRRLVVGIGEHHLHIVAEVVIYPDLASLWCDEVDFRIGSSDSRMFAIGFRNDRQGYVLRNSFVSLSHAKPPENLPEYLICGYLSGYLGDVGDGCTKVFGE